MLGLVPWLAGASPAPVEPAEQLVGVWGSERVLGPQIRGELTLVRGEGTWRARIAGFDVPARVGGGKIAVVFPGGQGEFQGSLEENGRRITGHWIQPRVLMSGMKFATPVELHALQADVWRGEVAPLEDRFSLYLAVQKQPDGSVSAFIRHPERNFGNRMLFRAAPTSTSGPSQRKTAG
ncbi:hypothetical protein [Stigmatella aurantiaca]|uniref:hypothetical protein n=1 Tax=Stigmatella aurantiaca TaxID=41 RepID=UPI001E45F714|nr:hypothetical protein [Stigmatella aurantiaca]